MNWGRFAASRHRIALGSLLLAGAWLRLWGLDWDDGHHLHPDERFLTMVASAIRFPSSLAEYFDTARSTLNPANVGYRFFVYGTLPLFLVRATAAAFGLADYAHIHLVGRALSALFDLGTVVLTYQIGKLLAGPRVALAAAAFVTFGVLSIQQAHFFTVDSFATFFATASVWTLARVALGGGVAAHAWFGAALGLTIACRPNLVSMGLLYPVALAYAWRTREVPLARLAGCGAVAGITAALVVRGCLPYAFAGPGFFSASLAPAFVESLQSIRALATGAADYPPGVQWIGRLPVVFPARNLLLWSLGPAWGLAAVAGLVWCFLPRHSDPQSHAGAGRVVLLWAPLLFLQHGTQFAPTGRYFLPLVPLLAIAAGWCLAGTAAPGRARKVALASTIALTALWAVAFTSIYRRPHTRVEASRWIYEHVEPGATIATEHWDDALPLGVDGRSSSVYEGLQLTLYYEDTGEKRAQLIDALNRADVIVLSSNRLYGSIPRTPWRYPLTRRYYELLFAEELGFRLERVFTSYPRMGPFEIDDDEAEEAFTVYDHPKVLVFRKERHYSPARTAQLLNAVSLSGIIRVPPREAHALYWRMRPADVQLRSERDVRHAVGDERIGSLEAAARWIVAFEAMSIALFAVLFAWGRGLGISAYGFAKVLAWIGPGTVVWLLASTGLAPHTETTSRAVLGGVLAVGAWAAWRRRSDLRSAFENETARRTLVATEAVFLGVFALFVGIRALNPAIYWGEKPMDFAILNALMRSSVFPPADPWFAGATLNYFYFGHALTAIFATITGVPPAFAFNLAVGTVAALLATAACVFVHRVTGRVVPAVGAAFAVTIAGNLAGPRLFAAWPPPRVDFNYFWATSRVVPGTINEFPFWNLVFADLHAHVLSMPLEVALLFLGSLWVVGRPGDRPVNGAVLVVLTGWLLGAVAVTSPWSFPLAAALQLGFLLTWWHQSARGWRELARVAAAWAGMLVLARVIFWPFWIHFVPPERRWGWLSTEAASVADVMTIFGVFLLAALPLAAMELRARRLARVRRAAAVALITAAVVSVAALRSPACAVYLLLAVIALFLWITTTSREIRLGALLLGAAGAAGALTETLFIWDRMNTVFKFYLQMWPLLACAAAVYAWGALRAATGRVKIAVAVVIALAAAAGSFTSVSGAVGYVSTPHVRSGGPTLDGTGYLAASNPSELRAYEWLNREIRGIPVLLEAQGPPYQAFSRVSMNTGLPTVLGWEYHLLQQSRALEEIAARAEEVRTLFETPHVTVAERLLRKYRIDLVFIGPLERRTYAAAGLAKFSEWPLLERVFHNRDVTIYATPGRRASVKTWIEPVPRALPAGLLREPRGIATAPDGTLFVADFGNRRIQRFSADLGIVDTFGAEGTAPGEYRDPCGIAVGPDGSIWVADTWNHRVQKLSPAGEPLGEWRAELYGPRGIAVAPDGSVYVSDTGHHRILRFDGKGQATTIVPPGLMDHPVGVALSASGELYVADTGHRRVVVFSPDGHLVRQWRIQGWTPDAHREPHLAVGPDSMVWVTDPSGRRVLLFDSDGTPRGLAVPSSPLLQPLGIALVAADRAIVTDAGSGRLVEVRRGSAPSP